MQDFHNFHDFHDFMSLSEQKRHFRILRELLRFTDFITKALILSVKRSRTERNSDTAFSLWKSHEVMKLMKLMKFQECLNRLRILREASLFFKTITKALILSLRITKLNGFQTQPKCVSGRLMK